MRFYRVHRYEIGDGSAGCQFFTARAAAVRAARAWVRENPDSEAVGSIDIVEVRPTKAGILRALNRYASHPDNG